MLESNGEGKLKIFSELYDFYSDYTNNIATQGFNVVVTSFVTQSTLMGRDDAPTPRAEPHLYYTDRGHTVLLLS
jgi:hypothetical protein